MKHLQELRKFLSSSIPNLTDDKFFMNVINGKDHDGQVHYTVRLLFIDFRGIPFDVLNLVRQWLRATRRLIEPDQIPILSFDCEVVDSETYDLEVDIPMNDHIIDGPNGATVCDTPVWDDASGTFISPGC